MAFRRKMKRRKSRRLFSKTASRVHGKNLPRGVMRGGTRL